ncbi:MAG: 3-deoxy-D-manno-octulosonic acid transferase [Acidobacteria bacterium]|nr:3-deoxy-D-manno-octulosonic acid transferase [Acidobacteriota bacterium]
MFLLYRLLAPLVFALIFPYFLLQAIRHGKYRAGFRQRLGFDLPEFKVPHPRVWIHAVSVGEVMAIEPLVRRMEAMLPGVGLVVSTTTRTGQQIAQTRLGAWATVIYFPLDFSGCVQRSLSRVEPDLVLLAETEIWPNFLAAAAKRRVPVFLVNARISDRSFTRYRWIRGFIGGLLNRMELVMAQSDEDASRYIALGCNPSLVITTGNLKFDADLPPPSSVPSLLRRSLWDGGAKTWIAGSTTPGEERMILEALLLLRRGPESEKLRLILAPRHPERFDEVASLLRELKIPFQRMTDVPSTREGQPANVMLLDTMGDLPGLYPSADLVFVGGSLTRYGGHNILEPARFARPIIVGPYTDNFRAITREFLARQALIQLPHGSSLDLIHALAQAVRMLLENPAEQQRIGARALACVEQNRGAADRILKLISPRIEDALIRYGRHPLGHPIAIEPTTFR